MTDGSPTGPVVAEIINWTGQVIVAPRAQLHELAGREDLQRTGLYVLVGPDPDAQGGRDMVYIGEADEVFHRLKQHDRDENKEFWTRAVAITSKDFNLTKSHGRYLESRLIAIAAATGRATVINGTAPGQKTLPESDVADMEYFIAQIELILPVLGFDFLRPQVILPGLDLAPLVGSSKLIMEEVGARAIAYEVDGQFVVQKGSTARRQGTESWEGYVGLRDDLVKDGKLVSKDDRLFEFAQDVEFSSPSAAAAVVAAANRNGRKSWRLENGRTYAEWKEAQLAAAETKPTGAPT